MTHCLILVYSCVEFCVNVVLLNTYNYASGKVLITCNVCTMWKAAPNYRDLAICKFDCNCGRCHQYTCMVSLHNTTRMWSFWCPVYTQELTRKPPLTSHHLRPGQWSRKPPLTSHKSKILQVCTEEVVKEATTKSTLSNTCPVYTQEVVKEATI